MSLEIQTQQQFVSFAPEVPRGAGVEKASLERNLEVYSQEESVACFDDLCTRFSKLNLDDSQAYTVDELCTRFVTLKLSV